MIRIFIRGSSAHSNDPLSDSPADGFRTLTLDYDESDNRIELHLPQEDLTFTYVVDDADNLVESFRQEGSDPPVLVETFTVDADGNMSSRTNEITEETLSYRWDDSDKLIRASSNIHGPIQDNRYDAGGIRKRKRDKNGNSSREYTAGLVTAASKPGSSVSNDPTISYITPASGYPHQLLGFEKNGNFSYFLTDALSTLRDLVDDDGEVLASYEFDEYGQRLATNENGASSPKTFAGGLSVQDEVADTGLMLMGHRFYDPTLGRFLNRDPIGFAGGLNLFGYAQGNPVRFVDADGLEPVGDAVNWWLWDSTVPGPYGNPNPEDWGTLGDVGSWNDLVDYVCSHGSGAERVLFVSALITGVGATAIAGGTGLAQASGRIPQMVLDGKKFGKSAGRIFQIRPNVGRGSSQRASEGIFRLAYHKLPKGNAKTLHYHRKPNMKQHHSLGGKEFAALAGAAAGYIALIIQCKPKKECE